MNTLATATQALPTLSRDLASVPTPELTNALETILRVHHDYTNRIVAELAARAPDGETAICCDEFDHLPISVWVRVEKYLK